MQRGGRKLATDARRYGIRGVSHAYAAGVPVLRDVDFEIEAGKVEGLVGENGSGKSTLIKCLTGVLRPRLGSLYLDDREVEWSSPADAQQHGVGVVHQDYNLFPDLSVAQNVVGVGAALPRRRLTRTVDKAQIESEVAEMLQSLGIGLAPETLVRTLDPAERKFVEIVRAMRLEPRFLILDEPTASLEPQASKSVIELLKRLRERGLGLAFVSHRLDEVLDIADRVTVLRDGVRVDRVEARAVDHERLAGLIVGRSEHERRTKAARSQRAHAEAEVRVKIRDLRLEAGRPPVSFEIRRGEILGLTGLLGSGAATVVRMLGGAEPMRGVAEVDGRRVRIRDPRHAERVRIGFIPEDRKSAGAVPELSVAINISLPSLRAVTRAGVVDYWKLRARAEHYAEKLDVRAESVDVSASSLSGGNLQKVLIGKWLASRAEILAIEEPTHGVDIGAKVQVHQLLREFVADGGSIVVALSEADEALELCDRIAVFRHGALVTIRAADELTLEELTVLCAAERSEHVAAADDGTSPAHDAQALRPPAE